MKTLEMRENHGKNGGGVSTKLLLCQLPSATHFQNFVPN